MISNFPVKVVYTAKELGDLFEHKAWKESLRKLLITLMRESAIFLKPDAVNHAIETNLITREEAIVKFCSRSQAVVVKRGRKAKTEKVARVPKKPRASPLLLRKEMEFLNYVSQGIFTEPGEEELSNWPAYITQFGFGAVRAQLESNYNLRRQYLSGFSRITTARLTEFRKLKPAERYKKKKDITPSDVDALLVSRENPPGKFAREVSFVDAQFQRILSVYRTVSSAGSGGSVLDFLGSVLKLEEDIRSAGVYSDIETIKQQEITPAAKDKLTEKKVELPQSSQGKDLPAWTDLGFKEVEIKIEPPPCSDSEESDVINEPETEYKLSEDERLGNLTDSIESDWDALRNLPLDHYVIKTMAKLKESAKDPKNLNTIPSCDAINQFLKEELTLAYKYLRPSELDSAKRKSYPYLVESLTDELKKFKLKDSRKAISAVRDFIMSSDSGEFLQIPDTLEKE